MGKFRKFFELFEFTTGKVRLLLVILFSLVVLFSFQFVYNFLFLNLFYAFQSFLIVIVSAYGIWVVFTFTSKVRLVVKVIKRMVKDYYPFSSTTELEKFVFRNLYYVFKGLREYKRLYESILEVIYNIAEIGIVILDNDRNILTYNIFVEKVFGVSQDCRGKKFYSLFSLITPKIEELKEDSSKEVEIQYGDEVRIMKVFLKRVNHLSLICFVDVTELKEVERISDLSLSIFSHELKTPLTNLSLALENMIISKEFSEEIIETLLSNITRISSTISNIVSLSNIVSRRIVVNRRAFNMKSLVEKVISQIYPSYKTKNLRISFNYWGNEEFIGDEDKLYLVLFNVIDNAMKFSPEGGEVGINVFNETKLRFEVFNKTLVPLGKDIDKVFDKFFRAKNSVWYKGSGLGLYIVKNLCDLMKFKVEISEVEDVIILKIFEE